MILNLKLEEGNIIVFVGPSGCGKTTTVKMINRLIKPTSGQVLINGEDISNKNVIGVEKKYWICYSADRTFPTYDNWRSLDGLKCKR